MSEYVNSMKSLIEELKKLPGVGPKSAQRLAFHILETPERDIVSLTSAIIDAKKKIKNCSTCFNISDSDPCSICSDLARDHNTICVVEDPKDLIAIERSRSFGGVFHVLGGTISPLDGIGPDSLRIRELVSRIKDKNILEIVLAMNPTIEGDVTAIYLTKVLLPLSVKVTRIACGIPIGGDLDYADEATLTKSLEGRREINV